MSYNSFAYYYDDLTENVEYENRAEYIYNFFKQNNVLNGTLLDLACGTGSMSVQMLKYGYNVIGADLSQDMLSIAQNKSNGKIQYVNADMTDFMLPFKVDACMCNLDSINHLSDIEQVKKTFECVYNCLNKNGIFVFDVNTIYKHLEVLADNSFIFDDEDYFLAWDNEQLDDNVVRILIDIFVYNGKNYDRYSEEFTEKAYDELTLKDALEPFFDVLGVYDELTLDEPKEDSQRLYFVCKRKD